MLMSFLLQQHHHYYLGRKERKGMKLFFFALREYDEKGFLEECAAKYGFEYGYTSDYPNVVRYYSFLPEKS